MVGDLGEGRRVGVERADRLGDSAMKRTTARRRQGVVERFADERVAETVAAGARRVSVISSSATARSRGSIKTSGGLPIAAASALSENSRPSTEATSSIWRASSGNGCVSRLMNSLTPRGMLSRTDPVRRAAGELPVRRHLAKHLVQEERIAFGRVAQEVDERARRPHAPGALDELADVGFAKPSQRQHQTLALGFGDERGKLRQDA